MAKPNPIQMQKHLKGVSYPASKDALLEKARQSGADDTVLTTLRRLPDTEFNSPNDVSQAVGRLGDE
jgi:hypothetical protein